MLHYPVIWMIVLFGSFRLIFSDDFPSMVDPNILQFPWIWDAVFDPNEALVSLTSVNRGACDFHIRAWKKLSSLFPVHAKLLGSGLVENVLINTHKYQTNSSTTDYFMRTEGILGKQFICKFYSNNSLIVALKSLPISIKREIRRVSPLVIFCPVPAAAYTPSDGRNSFTHVSLSLYPANPSPTPYNYLVYNPLNENNIQEAKIAEPLYLERESNRFPVRALPLRNVEAPMYGSSVCTAMMGGRRETMVEWIEYHRLIGIEHFYIYNTATTESGQQALSAILSDYVHEGIVTLVPWPYQNCVRNFTNGGRSFFYYLNESRDHKDLRIFKPPNPISQTAALTSCFVRFKSTSKYMIHIDIDEFIAVNKDGMKEPSTTTTAATTTSLITAFANKVFDRYSLAIAMYLRPIMVSFCPHLTEFTTPYFKQKGSQYRPSSSEHTHQGDERGTFVLPKLGMWQHGNHGTLHEGKLIMRSDMVDNYFVHYIAQRSSDRLKAMGDQQEDMDNADNAGLETGAKRKLIRRRRRPRKRRVVDPEDQVGTGLERSDGEDDAVFIYPKVAVLYHFKEDDPFFLSTLIPGHTWNSSEKEQILQMQCSFKQQILFVRNSSRPNPQHRTASTGLEGRTRKAEDRGDISHHGLSIPQVDELIQRYYQRVTDKKIYQ